VPGNGPSEIRADLSAGFAPSPWSGECAEQQQQLGQPSSSTDHPVPWPAAANGAQSPYPTLGQRTGEVSEAWLGVLHLLQNCCTGIGPILLSARSSDRLDLRYRLHLRSRRSQIASISDHVDLRSRRSQIGPISDRQFPNNFQAISELLFGRIGAGRGRYTSLLLRSSTRVCGTVDIILPSF